MSIREAASKNYVDNLFNDPGIYKKTAHLDLKIEIIPTQDFFKLFKWLKLTLI